MVSWSAIILTSQTSVRNSTVAAAVYLTPEAIFLHRLTLVEVVLDGRLPTKFGFNSDKQSETDSGGE